MKVKSSRLEKVKLKIGKIPYANLFPIFYYLEKECNGAAYKFIKGVPSKLNKMLRQGDLDISISSSIEYLKNKSAYRILPCSSISSSGAIQSILLFSKFPLRELGGKTIALSSESETSVMLLKVIMKNFLSLRCKYKSVQQRSVKNILSSFPAVLHIGDTAMREAKKMGAKVKSQELGVKRMVLKSNRGIHNSKLITPDSIYIYDLGELWDKYTGVPFVFALWIVRKEAAEDKKELIKQLLSDLMKAKKYAGRKRSLLAGEAPQRKWLSEKELADYWKIISYDFTEKHLEGLRLFEKHALRNQEVKK